MRLLPLGFEHKFKQRNFLQKVQFTDEAIFNRDWIFNYKRGHVWTAGNPNATVMRGHQEKFIVNVWTVLYKTL